MKIAVTSDGWDLDSRVDPRFGRSRNFILVDPATMEFEVVENVQNLNAAQGAGIQAAQIVAEHGADVLLTGNCGPKAFRTLSAAGVKVCCAVSRTVREAVRAYQSGELKTSESANVEEHWI